MMIESGYTHTFPAVRGTQAGRPFYICMCPLRVLTKIFVFDEQEVPPELRAQRSLNKQRIPEMARYIVEHPDSYVFSAITASVDSNVRFSPLAENGPESNMGMISIPMEAQILINDGQHRRAAIEQALDENPDLGHDNIPVLFFADEGLVRSQQMFHDLNKYAIRPSTSLTYLYDHEDQMAALCRHLALNTEPFKGFVELEKSSIAKGSPKLFTLSAINSATRAFLCKSPRSKVSEDEANLAEKFWTTVGENMIDWQLARQKKIMPKDLRENYVHAHGIALHAFGLAGADLVAERPRDWEKPLAKIQRIDWSRSNTKQWEGRAMVHGRIQKAKSNVLLTVNVVKKALGVKLTPEEQELEVQWKQ